MPKMIDMTGRRFGRLVVLHRVDSTTKHINWLTQCDCGKQKVIPTTNLLRGKSASCGCLRSEVTRRRMTGSIPVGKLAPGMSGLNVLFGQYRQKAYARGLAFDLPLNLFAWLTQQPCQYCGAPPTQHCYRHSSNGVYIYNGVDRLDNSFGYFEWNVVPCCGVCNIMKGSINYSDFIAHLTTILEYEGKGFTLAHCPREIKEDPTWKPTATCSVPLMVPGSSEPTPTRATMTSR